MCVCSLFRCLLHRWSMPTYCEWVSDLTLRGLTPAHCDAISAVLERHRIAAVAQDCDGRFELLGPIHPTVRDVFAAVWEHQRVAVPEIVERTAVPADTVRRALDELMERRLVQQDAGHYHPLVAR